MSEPTRLRVRLTLQPMEDRAMPAVLPTMPAAALHAPAVVEAHDHDDDHTVIRVRPASGHVRAKSASHPGMQWQCNAYNSLHDEPSECSDPGKGGKWVRDPNAPTQTANTNTGFQWQVGGNLGPYNVSYNSNSGLSVGRSLPVTNNFNLGGVLNNNGSSIRVGGTLGGYGLQGSYTPSTGQVGAIGRVPFTAGGIPMYGMGTANLGRTDWNGMVGAGVGTSNFGINGQIGYRGNGGYQTMYDALTGSINNAYNGLYNVYQRYTNPATYQFPMY